TGGNSVIALGSEQMQPLAEALEAAGDADQAAIARAFIRSKRPLVATLLETDTAPASVPEAYLKLHLLSHRLVKPHDTDLAGAFGVLPNVAWTHQGAIDREERPERQLQARLSGELLEVACVD